MANLGVLFLVLREPENQHCLIITHYNNIYLRQQTPKPYFIRFQIPFKHMLNLNLS